LRTEKQKMLAGELYRPDAELGAEQAAAKAWMARYNAALASPPSERHALLCEGLGHVGKDTVIRPPFFCDYGYNIHLGDGVFLNFNCRNPQQGARIWPAGADRLRRLDWWRCHYPPRRQHRRRGGDRRRQRGDAGRRERRYRHGKSGPAATEVTVFLPLRFTLPPAMEDPMFMRRTIRITGPASA